MKKLYFLVTTFLFITIANAQIVNIPNANFKAKLLQANTTNSIAQNSSNSNIKIDTNNDGEIQLSEALLVYKLNVVSSGINSIVGIESFANLQRLYCGFNGITNLNLSGLTNLQELSCNNMQLTNLDVSELTNLQLLFCNNNQITNLDVSGLNNLQELWCNHNQLTNLNVSGLNNLQMLSCFNTSLTNLDASGLSNLQELNCSGCIISNLNISGLINLQTLSFSANSITNLDVNELTNLQNLYCHTNQLTNIDVSGLTNLKILECYNNPLTTLFIKNNNSQWYGLNFQNSPTLQYICADDEDVAMVEQKIMQYGYTNCHVNSYCSFTPGGTLYTIHGTNKIDVNIDGCDDQDGVYPNLKLNITNGSINGSFISNDSGNYSIPVQSGTHTITPQLENPSYFTISPTSTTVSFPTTVSPFTQSFCITPFGVIHDLEILIFPIGVARPGFNAAYKVRYKNKGNQTENTTINFNFNDAILDFVSSSITPSSQSGDLLTWNVGTLLPLQSGEIFVTLNLNSPMETPAVNSGDLLNYAASINGLNTDVNQEDNYFNYTQTVVNSYDPNDKECLDGNIINPNMIGKYVNYKIRFENTGTYPAQNIVVRDNIDTTKFDISTLQITSASHNCVTRITNSNKVEFIFENINLPFDDANNDGYIVFKIKTKPTLVAGNTISNLANIYFDYNFPIVTNTSTSTFATLGVNEVENKSVVVYPNPTTGIVNINCNDTIKNIVLYDIQGRLLMTKIVDSQNVTFELSNQNTGTYFVKVITDNGVKIEKVLKN